MKASWGLQVIAAVILLQTLFFKFTGAEESVYIFTRVHAEPWGRYASALIELLASVLLLVPGYASLGALIALCVGAGAILSHLTVLGIDVKGDGGLLFALAVTVFVSSLLVLVIRWRELPTLVTTLTGVLR